MIVLFTDFGNAGPYVGQIKVALYREAPSLPILDLMHDAPSRAPRAAAYLLAALVSALPRESVVLAVVDPGVGTARAPVALRADRRWFVGPDNGLFQILSARARAAQWWEITWRPARLSASFHGRDLFAPVAARLALGLPITELATRFATRRELDWPMELAEVIYIDAYGNAMTGLRAASLAPGSALSIDGRRLARARTFGDVSPGQPFWYENSLGLIEIAVNQGSAATLLGLEPGHAIEVA